MLIMASPSSSFSSVSDNLTSLALDLSLTNLNQFHFGDVFMIPNAIRGRSKTSSVDSSSIRRSVSEGRDSSTILCAETQVLVISTGGTISMTLHDNVLSPEPNAFVKCLRKLPILHDEQYAQQTSLYDYCDHPETTLVLPPHKPRKRIVYTVSEYCPLLDSSNMTAKDWVHIGEDIKTNYKSYDGFVILHGTDTMAYTTSALSFMCENLGKPVIVTGSQVPIYQIRSDGRDNLLGALLIAGQFVIPEVCLYFNNRLFRGNRVTKVDVESFYAFNSPNLSPLAIAEVDIKINWDIVWRPNTTAAFNVSRELNMNVGLLRLFPGITTDTVKAFLQPPMDGVVLETYGSGNAPNNRKDLLDELKKATDRGVIIVNCTQCLKGTVSLFYATGQALVEAGLIAGGDMTPEAALTKLAYVLAMPDIDLQTKKKKMETSLRGEMVSHLEGAKLSLSDSRFIQHIAKSLSVSCKEELEAIRDALMPPLACAAARNGDLKALEAISEMGCSLSVSDYDGRTPLHVACCEGHYEVVNYLLRHDATVYAKDRYGHTALSDAVRFRHRDIVKLLRSTGAHFSRDELEVVACELCRLAASGDMCALEIWHLAGADFTKTSYDGQTALAVAEAAGNEDVMTFIHRLMSQTIFGDINERDDDEGDEVFRKELPPPTMK